MTRWLLVLAGFTSPCAGGLALAGIDSPTCNGREIPAAGCEAAR